MFISNNTDYVFKIDKINSIYEGVNEYIDLQYAKLKLSNNHYKLKFEIDLYIAGNYVLPNDCLMLKVSGPTFSIDNINIIETNNSIDATIPNIQRDCIKTYKAFFELNAAEDSFFNGNSNCIFDLNLSLDINTESMDKNNSNIDPIVFKKFLNELHLSSQNIKIEYDHYYDIDNNSKISLPMVYVNDILDNKYIKKQEISFELEDLSFATNSFYKIFSFSFNENINVNIINTQLDISYTHDNIFKTSKIEFTKEYNLNTNNVLFELNSHETYFDESKKEIIFTKGNKGFCFPFDTNGWINACFSMIINNKVFKFNVKNFYNYFYFKKNINVLIEQNHEELTTYNEIFF